MFTAVVQLCVEKSSGKRCGKWWKERLAPPHPLADIRGSGKKGWGREKGRERAEIEDGADPAAPNPWPPLLEILTACFQSSFTEL